MTQKNKKDPPSRKTANGQGKKEIIIAVSGGFDPPHIGHVRLFKEAKEKGDKLVVILNNDNWLKAKKGYVFMPQNERKELIESFACVDKVVLTSHASNPKDMSVCEDLKKLRPNVFVNGGDRNKKNIPEVDVCNAIKCRMIFNVGEGGKIQSSSWLLKNFGRKVILSERALDLTKKRIIVFNLDGTLTQSKAVVDEEMAKIFSDLLAQKTAVIVGDGVYSQFEKQFLSNFKHAKALKNLFFLPASESTFYQFKNQKWQPVAKLASINAIEKGADKGYGIEQIARTFKTTKDDLVFIGGALSKAGNDFCAIHEGIDAVEVSGPEETKYFIRSLLS